MVKQLLILTLAFLATCFSPSALMAADAVSVKGMTFEGDIQGLGIITMTFNSDNEEGEMIMQVMGQKEKASFTYEQNDTQIIVHAKNGDISLTPAENGDLTMVMKSLKITLHPKTVLANENSAMKVANHTFTGNLGTGTLTLRFTNDNTVNVLLNTETKKQNSVWPYQQEGAEVIMTEELGRNIKLTINGDNELSGMFTIAAVRLRLVE